MARKYDISFADILSANDADMDPWIPGENQKLLIPKSHILPFSKRDGIVINIGDLRLYYFRDNELIDTYLNTLEVEITHEQMYTKNGGLKKKYIPILTWQKAIDNQTQKDAEDAALKSLEDGIAHEIENN